MQIVIDNAYDGVLLRTYLRSVLGLSVKMISRLKNDEEGIVVNGTRVTVRYVLRAGDALSLMDADRVSGRVIPADLPVEILYEDDDVVVVNKPPDMPTHPSHGHLDDTLANALLYRYRQMGIPFVFRPVSRLDRNTSGLVLVAKNKIASARLDAAIRERRIQKTYLALLCPAPKRERDTIETYICRTNASIITRRVCAAEEEGAAYALTEYETVASTSGAALVSAHPYTGRTHQLRVHFSFIGCPILGDDLYGEVSQYIKRQALHAAQITFPHPRDGRAVTVSAPLPQDICVALQAVGFSKEAIEKSTKLIVNKQN